MVHNELNSLHSNRIRVRDLKESLIHIPSAITDTDQVINSIELTIT